MAPEQKPTQPSPEDQESYSPKLTLAKNLKDHLNKTGASHGELDVVLINSERYLEKLSSMELIAIGIIAVSGEDEMASFLVKKEGYVVDLVTYGENFNDEKHRELEDEFVDVIGDSPVFFNKNTKAIVAGGFLINLTSKDCEDIDDFKKALNDNERRKNITASSAPESEFWGMVTIEELRREMANVPGI